LHQSEGGADDTSKEKPKSLWCNDLDILRIASRQLQVSVKKKYVRELPLTRHDVKPTLLWCPPF
jgi:hypothetical protein